MNHITAFFKKIVEFFHSPALKKRLAQAYDILEVAVPIVEQVATICPAGSGVAGVIKLIDRYALPLIAPAGETMTEER